MMKPALDCPYASYDSRMRIQCSKAAGLCGNQRYKPCKGWCVLTESAGDCPARVEPAAGKVGK